jgi:hypothetical protein
LQQTPAYIDLMFAFADARLGEVGAARALLSSAAAALDASGNDAHRFLLEAFRWRIEQVFAGKPHAGPLPPEQIEYLEQMRQEYAKLKAGDPVVTMAPYVVERMRNDSRILDPHEELDPYRHVKREHDDQIRDLARLADVHDPRTLSDKLRRLIANSKSKQLPDVRLRILAEALPLAARVGAVFCGEVLDQVGPMLAATPETTDPNVQGRRTVLMERALFFAVHFDRTDLVPHLVGQLERLIAEPAASTVLEARSRLIGQSLRSLRKCGLRDQTDRLLQLLADAVHYDPVDSGPVAVDSGAMESMRTLLHVAAGWLSSGQTDRARPVLDRARGLILSEEPAKTDRPAALVVSLTCTYIGALARAPLDEALSRVEELFSSGRMDRVPNTFTTSAYFSRFHLNIAEAVVLALANEEFAMGPSVRRWLDDDEYLVRRRIHRDVRQALDGGIGAPSAREG